MKMEEALGEMLLRAEEHLEPPEDGRGQDGSSPNKGLGGREPGE